MMLLRALLPPALLLGCAARLGIEDSRARIQELEKENAELREQIEALEARLRLIDDQARGVTICTIQPSISGTVLEVDREHGRVVLDQGQRDGVRVGYTFSVYLGLQYKGMVRVTEVQESTSLALVVAEKREIAAGDSATTRLY